MDDAYYVNAAELSNHQDSIDEQKHTAQRLQDIFRTIKKLSVDAIVVDGDVLRRFQQISERIDDLTQFYVELNKALENINDDANMVSRKVAIRIDNQLAEMSKKHLA